ncbi:MAG: L-ribulose-5-phosphate 3-epimerase [Lachnospiraceae bacterium]|nr:L-ribulose-5-phosphate 3-epimerase [Lachnospiraceae bacterium]
MNRQYKLGMYEKAVPKELSWKEKFEAAKTAGFDFIELSVDETDEKLARLCWTQEERRDLLRIAEDCGMPLRSMCLSGHRKYPIGSADKATRERGMEIMEQALALAADLGIRMIQLAGYDVYYEDSTEETRALFEKNLHIATELAARYGVIMGFETMETPFMNTVEKAMSFVDMVNLPYLQVYPDLGNITNAAVEYGTRVADDLETGRGHLIAMHLKETVPGVFREVPFGTGHVDFDAGIRKAWMLGVRRFVTEFWYTGESNWREIAAEACAMMRGKLDVLCK